MYICKKDNTEYLIKSLFQGKVFPKFTNGNVANTW